MSDTPQRLDLAGVRARLEKARGREYWRSLDDLASTKEFQELLVREFPQQAIGWSEDEDANEGRRNFLKMMGASLALAGLTACTRQPTEHIAPYIRQPEDLVPGKPLFYATATTLHGVANGVLVESHEGRPTKVEGNPEHPATLGACDVFSQASVLQLYDPDRSQTLMSQGEIKAWGDFLGSLARTSGGAEAQERRGHPHSDGDGDLTGDGATRCTPSRSYIPAAKWHQWEPAGPHSARAGAIAGFWRSHQYLLRSLQGQRGRFAGFGFPGVGRRRRCVMRGNFRIAPPRAGRPDHYEPALRGGADAHAHRHQGRPPFAAARRRYRRVCLGAGDGAGRANGPKTGDNGDIYRWIGPIAQGSAATTRVRAW